MKFILALTVILFATTCFAGDVEINVFVKKAQLAAVKAKLPGKVETVRDVWEMQQVRRPNPQINDALIHTPQYIKVNTGSVIKVTVPEAKLREALTLLKGTAVEINYLEDAKPYKLGTKP